MKKPHTIQVGDLVRSYDFPDFQDDKRPSFVEGIVEAITDHETHPTFRDCNRYQIHVSRRVFGGKERTDQIGVRVFPPVNGTPSWLGGVTEGVVVLAKKED